MFYMQFFPGKLTDLLNYLKLSGHLFPPGKCSIINWSKEIEMEMLIMLLVA